MAKLRIALIGAGLVGQAEHAFYLWEGRERFELAALIDPSAAVRASLGERYGIRHLLADTSGLAGLDIDAAVIAAPDAFHVDLATQALDAGLHVLCEKPLALTLSGCDHIRAARNRSGRVVQVAYMKRHDPAYRKALEFLPDRIEDIKLISVEVNDPDHEPFVAHLPITWPGDLPDRLRSETRSRSAALLAESAARPLGEAESRALGGGFLSAMVHDVAVVHGMLDHLGTPLPTRADFGTVFDEGRGVQLGFALPGGGRVAMTHLNLPGVPDYTERLTVYTKKRIVELTFPSPYLRHLPTWLGVRQSGGGNALETIDFRASYEEAFREQLRAFHAAVTEGGPIIASVEEARADIELLVSAFRRAIP
jgi:predicted dehydrogenase